MYKAVLLCTITYLLVLGSPARAEELSIPDCDGLGDWASTYHPSRMIDITPEFQLVNIFGDEVTTQVFGKRALDWNREEYRAVSSALRACARKHRKQKEQAKVFSNARSAMGRSLRRAQNHLARLDRNFESVRKRLLDQPETARTYERLAGYDTVDELTKRHRGLAGAPRERTEALVADITAYRAQLRDQAVEKTVQAIEGLPEEPRSLVSINQLMLQVLTDYDDQAERQDMAMLEELAQTRRDTLREALMTGEPPMLFPGCEPFFTWAAAANVQQPIRSGAGVFYDALLDEKLVPVFAKPLEAWTDDEVALFREGAQVCMQSVSREEQAAQEAVRHASFLNRTIPTARTAVGKYQKAKLELEEQRNRMAKMEPTLAALQELSRMQNTAELRLLTREEQQQQRLEIQQRQQELAARIIDDSIQKLQRFGENLQGLTQLGEYRKQVLTPIQGFVDPEALRRFEMAFRTRDAKIAAAALPEFESRLQELPVSPESPEAARNALALLLAPRRTAYTARARYPHGSSFPGGMFRAANPNPEYLAPYREATQALTEEIEVALEKAMCDKILAEATLSPSLRQEALLGALGPTTVGDFVCRMVTAGHEFHSLETSSEDNSDYALEVTAEGVGYHTVTLHKGEVGPGQEMLVGLTVSDANVQRTLTVNEWQSYAGMLTGQSATSGLRFLQQLFKSSDQRSQQLEQRNQR